MIDTSSKMDLRLSCLRACDNDVNRARELYDFLSEGLEGIPEVVPEKPGVIAQVKQGADEVLGWLGTHRDEIAQGISFLQTIRKSIPAPVAEIPPIIPKV